MKFCQSHLSQLLQISLSLISGSAGKDLLLVPESTSDSHLVMVLVPHLSVPVASRLDRNKIKSYMNYMRIHMQTYVIQKGGLPDTGGLPILSFCFSPSPLQL